MAALLFSVYFCSLKIRSDCDVQAALEFTIYPQDGLEFMAIYLPEPPSPGIGDQQPALCGRSSTRSGDSELSSTPHSLELMYTHTFSYMLEHKPGLLCPMPTHSVSFFWESAWKDMGRTCDNDSVFPLLSCRTSLLFPFLCPYLYKQMPITSTVYCLGEGQGECGEFEYTQMYTNFKS